MPLHVAFLWHMHQPHYVDSVRGIALMPWVRLHATKGYLDMLWLVEQHPQFRCTFNLTPVLLQQIEQLAQGQVRDLWHELARTPAAELSPEQKRGVLEHFFKANWHNMIQPYPRYWALLQKRGQTLAGVNLDRVASQFSVQDFRDLQAWFNLTWFGYAAQRLYPEIAELKRKGQEFTEEDKTLIFERQQDVLQAIIGWYRQAAERGQIEISTTPFFHPILPLVHNTEFARRCLPGKPLPTPFSQPEDAKAQLQWARDLHQRLFGKPPVGLWPSEGSVCPELLPILQELGFRWLATDEEILWRSLKAADPQRHYDRHGHLYQGWRAEFGNAQAGIAFRDREISDFIGFSAARNTPGNAAKFILDKLGEVWQLARRHGSEPLCAVILDGENAWENFADGGEAFLRCLYSGLSQQPDLKTTTLGDYFQQHPPQATIQTLHTGSWINADFKIWIGHPEDNAGWERLGQTRAHLQKRLAAADNGLGPEQQKRAWAELFAAEGSDWFWWYGDDFVTDNDRIFDDLFRTHLQNVYRILGDRPPANLNEPICQVENIQEWQESTDLLVVNLDGRITSYYEWMGAGVYESGRAMGTMFQTERLVQAIRFGCDLNTFFLRVDFRKDAELPEQAALRLTFIQPQPWVAVFPLVHGTGLTGQLRTDHGVEGWAKPAGMQAAFETVYELAIPQAVLGWQSRDKVGFYVEVLAGDVDLERHPASSNMTLVVPDERFVAENWHV